MKIPSLDVLDKKRFQITAQEPKQERSVSDYDGEPEVNDDDAQ
jgi:hypothetical protein